MVSRGHNEHDVLYVYSIDKIYAYVHAAEETQQGDLLDLAVAFHNPKQLVNDMRKARASKKQRISGASSRADIDRLRQLATRRKG